MFATSQDRAAAASRNTKFVLVAAPNIWTNSKVKIFSFWEGYSPLERITLDLPFQTEIISQTRVILWWPFLTGNVVRCKSQICTRPTDACSTTPMMICDHSNSGAKRLLPPVATLKVRGEKNRWSINLSNRRQTMQTHFHWSHFVDRQILASCSNPQL